MSHWFNLCQHFDSVTSTMTNAQECAACGAPEGTTIIANTQTQGRGRHGSTWISEPGNGLWMTTILYPLQPLKLIPTLSLVTALATAHALEQLGAQHIGLKWPNDVWSHNKKLAGILLECSSSPIPTKPPTVLIGLGINLKTPTPSDAADAFEAIGLDNAIQATTTRPCPSKLVLLKEILKQLQRQYTVWTKHGPAPSLAEWDKYDVLRGQTVTADAIASRQPIQGTVQGIDANGHLLLIDPNQVEHKIQSGQVNQVRAKIC